MNTILLNLFKQSVHFALRRFLLLPLVLSAGLAIWGSTICFAATPDIECSSVDKKSDLSLRQTPVGLRMAIHSAELSLYTQIAYGIDLGRLELVREVDGSPVISLMPDGFTAMAFAPTTNRPDLIWSVVFTRTSKFSPVNAASTVSFTDIQGHQTSLDLLCN